MVTEKEEKIIKNIASGKAQRLLIALTVVVLILIALPLVKAHTVKTSALQSFLVKFQNYDAAIGTIETTTKLEEKLKSHLIEANSENKKLFTTFIERDFKWKLTMACLAAFIVIFYSWMIYLLLRLMRRTNA